MQFHIISLNLGTKGPSYINMCVSAKSLHSRQGTLCVPATSPPGFSVQVILQREYWRGCHAILQERFVTQGLNPHLLKLLHWQASFLSLVLHEKLHLLISNNMHDIKHHLKYLSRIKLLLIHICLNSKVHTHVSLEACKICIYVFYVYNHIYVSLYIFTHTILLMVFIK